MPDEPIYRVSFYQQGQVYEVFAKEISQGGLLGFVEIEGLLFGERSQVVVDPSEERLQKEFEGVRSFYVPLHAVIRIDQVERQGVSRIRKVEDGGDKVTPFPVPLYSPRGDSGSS